ncbi:DUF523 domain-containing protein [Nitratiruptor sp. YY09-18]|uniref:DUF523 domain-containing protein n=1 Tax=Nitratiruptor sp. YY09-18 TaxID=2724901 RepID=UPI001916062C|nr:DUF523 domain-containing protein [Nitratiruptor sp. YY09-18]BCD68644.1 hypothetical protein NitYY0918_C1561 [Nitratiruptor sp. YY09-18]
MSKKVLVSACLLGQNCRYNGGNKFDFDLIEKLKDAHIIAFCPEENILGTPRETIDIIESRAIGNESGKDYTKQLQEQARSLQKKASSFDAIYLKSKSPSCALCSARVYDKDKNLVTDKGEGIFAKELKKLYPKTKFYEREGRK